MATSDSAVELPEGVELHADIVFGTGGGRELKADLYAPEGEPGQQRPAVVYVHGGGWRAGHKSHFARQAAHMAGRGFLGLCPEYRLSAEATWPAALEDVNCAVRFLRSQAERLGVDGGRIGIVGGSAGGHLALMVAATGGTGRLEGQGGHGGYSSDVQAAVGFNPVIDLLELAEREGVQQFLGGTTAHVGAAVYEDASPLSHVSERMPPTLLLHGTDDATVPYEQSVRFCERAREAGGQCELFTAEGAGHAFFNGAPWFEPTLERTAAFLQEHLGMA